MIGVGVVFGCACVIRVGAGRLFVMTTFTGVGVGSGILDCANPAAEENNKITGLSQKVFFIIVIIYC